VADETSLTKVGQRTEMLSDGTEVLNPKVHDVEIIESQLAYVLFDLTAQLLRRSSGYPISPRDRDRARLSW